MYGSYAPQGFAARKSLRPAAGRIISTYRRSLNVEIRLAMAILCGGWTMSESKR